MRVNEFARLLGFVLISAIAVRLFAAAPDSDKPPRLTSTELKQPLIWSSECISPAGVTLGFGGQDQQADDGGGGTRLKVDGKWESISAELWRKHPNRERHAELVKLCQELKRIRQVIRDAWFEDSLAALEKQPSTKEQLAAVETALQRWQVVLPGNKKLLAQRTANLVQHSLGGISRVELNSRLMSWSIERLHNAVIATEEVLALHGAEPLPRALSPLAYDPKTGRFVLFGGDHCDFLLNDLWLFDPKTETWEVRIAENDEAKPAPRANHRLTANGDGTVTISGGYKYTSSTDYCGGQYKDHPRDSEYTYDIVANRWTSPAPVPAAPSREYRVGPFDPKYYLTAARPSRSAITDVLKTLPENTWVEMKPPAMPQLNRDWGTAIIDPDRDLILRFSGGHSAHGGSDVLHYHLATNRWELTQPVEFPLGQLYSNTEYPDGFNFNRRPWVTGHTYQNYGYAPGLKQMVFAGRETHNYFYDPSLGDWLPQRTAKPAGMLYNSCFYTLTLTSSPDTLYCWTQEGRLFSFATDVRNWLEIKLQGEKLEGAVVDNSTIIYDGSRKRLLCCRKPYGDKERYRGTWQAIDLATGTVSTLVPPNAAAAADVPYLCQIRIDPEHDLLLCGCTLPDTEDGIRRTPAFDLKENRWVSFRITGDDPSGTKGRNVSLGLMYDARRKLFWAVDAASRVFVLRFNPETAERVVLVEGK